MGWRRAAAAKGWEIMRRGFAEGRRGVLQGTYSYVLQDAAGQIANTHSVSAGLDYPSIGPEHAALRDAGRAEYVPASDAEALEATTLLARTEGIIPALESAHAVAEVVKRAPRMKKSDMVIVNISGRGDKDIGIMRENFAGLKFRISEGTELQARTE